MWGCLASYLQISNSLPITPLGNEIILLTHEACSRWTLYFQNTLVGYRIDEPPVFNTSYYSVRLVKQYNDPTSKPLREEINAISRGQGARNICNHHSSQK